MSLDLNDAAPQQSFDLIPDGTVAKIVGIIRPGGISRPGQEAFDGGWLTASRDSDVLYLSYEFTVADGELRGRKFWQNFTVSGGTLNERGESKAWNITKSTMRAMLNSARGVHPEDESQNALAARRINTWGEVNAIEFTARIGIRKAKPNSGYRDQNQIAKVIEPGDGAPAATAQAPVAAAPAAAWAKAPPPAAAASATPAWAR